MIIKKKIRNVLTVLTDTSIFLFLGKWLVFLTEDFCSDSATKLEIH